MPRPDLMDGPDWQGPILGAGHPEPVAYTIEVARKIRYPVSP